MKEIKIDGENVQDAIERGLDRIGLRREQVEVEIIQEGKKGLFGFGAKAATVKPRRK